MMDKLNSRKLILALLSVLGVGAADQLMHMSTSALWAIAVIMVAYLVAQGMADFGKETVMEEQKNADDKGK